MFTISTPNFNLKQTLESGQCFRYIQLKENMYRVVAQNYDFVLQDTGSSIKVNGCDEEWCKNYFDLNRDYNNIIETLSVNPIMEKVISNYKGLRVLNQDKWETLITFILSQQNNIPRIINMVNELCMTYGTLNDKAHVFPTLNQLETLSTEDFNTLGFGFRSKYVVNAIQKCKEWGTLEWDLSTQEIKQRLCRIYGVGDKVASCVILFAFKRSDVFPVDVWIKRVMQKLFFDNNEKRISEIQIFARETFGDNMGIAQQYLFKYGKDNHLS